MHPMQLRSPCVSQNGGGDGVQPHGSFSVGQVLAAVYYFYQEEVAAEEQLELLHVDPRLRRSVQVQEKSGMHLPHQSAHGAVQCVCILAHYRSSATCTRVRAGPLHKRAEGFARRPAGQPRWVGRPGTLRAGPGYGVLCTGPDCVAQRTMPRGARRKDCCKGQYESVACS